MIDTHEIMRIL